MSNPEQFDDPLNLEAVDRAIRINELESQLDEMGFASTQFAAECDAGEYEQFLQNVIDLESTPLTCPFERLIEAGMDLPEPDSLDDAALHAKLWEVINALAKLDTYLYRTDHLSDRELYEHLWTDSLREMGGITGLGSGWIHHIDMLGGCSEDDIQLGLKYYDDERTRARWAEAFPRDVIPAHEDPPFDRDRLLPQPPNPTGSEIDEDGVDDESDDD